LAGGYAAWYYRSWWLPRAAEKLEKAPEPIQEAVKAMPEPQVEIDIRMMALGFGIGLQPQGDYLHMLNVTRELDPGWKLSTAGRHVELRAPGVWVTAVDGKIMNYELDLKAMYGEPKWEPWRENFASAGLSPDVTYKAVTGEEAPHNEVDYEVRGNRPLRREGGWMTPVWILHFSDGWLREVKMVVELGESDMGQPDRPGPSVEHHEHAEGEEHDHGH
jgi:hypothetical protein